MRTLLALILSALYCVAAQWSIVQVGDIHAGATFATSNEWQSTVSWILAHTNDGVMNIKVVVSPGDDYEQDSIPGTDGTTSLQPTNVFNGLKQLQTNGLVVFTCPGNHDDDDLTGASAGSRVCVPGAGWNDWLGTNWLFPEPHFIGTMTSNSGVADTRNLVMAYTNAGIKLLFISYSWATNNVPDTNGNYDIPAAYLAQTQWITNTLAKYPDHLGIVCVHHMLNLYGDLAYWDTGQTSYHNIGPAQAAFDDGLSTCSNLFLVLSGHNRICLKQNHFVTTPSGQFADVILWNTQGFAPFIQLVNVVTMDTALQTVFVNSYDITNSCFMTNGQYTLNPTGTGSNAFNHSWSFPFPQRTIPATRVFRLQ